MSVVEAAPPGPAPLVGQPARGWLVEPRADVAVEVSRPQSLLEHREIHRRHRHGRADRLPHRLQRDGELAPRRAGARHQDVEGERATAALPGGRAIGPVPARRVEGAIGLHGVERQRRECCRSRSTAAATSAPAAPWPRARTPSAPGSRDPPRAPAPAGSARRAEDRVRPALRPAGDLKPEESVGGRGVGHEAQRRVARHAVLAVRAAGGLEQVGLVAQHQIERRVRIRREAPDGLPDPRPARARRVGHQPHELAALPFRHAIGPAADEVRDAGVGGPGGLGQARTRCGSG